MVETEIPKIEIERNTINTVEGVIEVTRIQETMKTTLENALNDVQEELNSPYSKAVRLEGDACDIEPPRILNEIEQKIFDAVEDLSTDLKAIVEQE